MQKFQTSYLLIVLFFLVSCEFAQSASGVNTEWTRIKDDKFEISIEFPADFLVDNDIDKSYIIAPVLASLPEVIDLFEKPKIIGSKKSVQMSLSVFQLRPVSNAKNYLWYFFGRDPLKDRYQNFVVGDFIGRKTLYDTDKALAMRIVFAIKNKIYLIDASAKNEDRKIYEKFVMSLMLNGKPLFKDPASDPTDASPSVIISTLQTSAEINEVLNQKQEKSEVKVVKSVASVKEDDVGQNYSRPLIILRRPDFEFIDAASRSNSSGLVKLKVTFLASGKIGEIAIVSDLSNGLTKFAIKAASKIKFLPAEIDGKKVDATKTIEYGFNVR